MRHYPCIRAFLVITALLSIVRSASAQQRGVRAFAIEAAGATVGSLVGFGVVYFSRDRCDVEDLGCTIKRAGFGIALSTVGAFAGDQIAGRMARTQPSRWGAAAGAVLGAGAGLGAWHLLTEELNAVSSPAAGILTYTISQGLVTALISRLAR